MTNMTALPIKGHNPLKIFFSGNQWADYHETWYVALKTQANYSLFK